MSQQGTQTPQPPYGSWQQSQPSDSMMPPAKRQRLSPSPASPATSAAPSPYAGSPYTTVPYSNPTLANQNGINRPQMNGMSNPQSFMPPPNSYARPAQTPSAMAPPPRPQDRVPEQQQDERGQRKEREINVNNLNDMVFAVGDFLDMDEEEQALISRRNNQSSNNAQPSDSFGLLSKTSFGAIGADHASARARNQGSEDPDYEKHREAARAASKAQEHHLDNPFLLGNCMRRRMERIASENGVIVPLEGLFDRVQNGLGGASAAPSVLNRNSPLEPMLSLLSLATNERVRSLMEDAYGLARGRQLGSDGVVPPEWSGLAVGTGATKTTAEAKSVTDTAWDQVGNGVSPGPKAEPLNRLPSPPASEAGSPKTEPQPTIAFPQTNSITNALATLARRERAAEEARLKLRAARKQRKAAQAAAASSTPGTPIDGAAPVDGAAPAGLVAPEVKMSKKAREAMEKSAMKDISEELQTKSANLTANMQLGGRKYNWMTGGSSTPARQVPGRTSTPLSAAKVVNKAPGAADVLAGVKDVKYGQWREDGIGGRGVHLRDWIGVLEMDGRQKRTLGWAYSRQGTERTDGVTSTIMTAEAASQQPSSIHTQVPGTAQAFAQQSNVGFTSQPQTPISATANFSQPWTASRPTTSFTPAQSNGVTNHTAYPSNITAQQRPTHIQMPSPLTTSQMLGQGQSHMQSQATGQVGAQGQTQQYQTPQNASQIQASGPDQAQRQQSVPAQQMAQAQTQPPTATPGGVTVS